MDDTRPGHSPADAGEPRPSLVDRLAFELSPHGILVLDSVGRITDANKAIGRMLGYEPAELCGRAVGDFAVPGQPVAHGHAMRHPAGPSATDEVPCLRGDGTPVLLAVEVHPLSDGAYLAFVRDVTSERETGAALRASEAHFRVIAEQATIGIALVQDERLTYVNTQFAGVFDLTVAQMATWCVDDYIAHIHPDDVERALEEARNQRTTVGPARMRHRIVTRAGRVRHVDLRVQPHDVEGFRAGVVVLQDITELMETEESLRWRLALDSLRLTAYKMASYADLQLLRPILHAVLRDAGLPVDACSVQVIDEQRDQFVQYQALSDAPAWVRTLDEVPWLPGSAVWHAWRTGQTAYRQTGEAAASDASQYREAGPSSMRSVMDVPFALGTIGVASRQPDAFTAEHIARAEQAAEVLSEPFLRLDAVQRVEELQARYQAIFQNVRDAILVLDHDVVHDGNMAACEAFGASPEALRGIPVRQVFGPEAGPLAPFCADRIAEAYGGEGSRFEWPLRRSDGSEFPAEVSLAPVDIAERRLVLALLRDVSERKRAEEERERLQQQVQHAQKLESLGVLAGGIAHDFNNLLMGVLGNASLALASLPADSPVRASLERIETAALQASDLSKQMLAYSGRGRFAVREVDVSAVVTGIAPLLDASTSKKARFVRELQADLPPVEADAAQVRQVVLNLVTNASEALGDGSGVVTIRTSVVHADRECLQSVYLDDALPEGEYVSLEVTDTGCGMDEVTRARIFEPFFSTKFTGRGLGLAAVLGIVRGHQGTIDVWSEPGVGSRFRVLLPVAASHRTVADLALAPAARGAVLPRGGGLVLVADDEPLVREVTQLTLEVAGFRVLAAADGQEAVDRFRERVDEITAVVLDVTMPQLGGDEVLAIIRETRPDIPVILSSGYSEQETTERLAGHGPDGFLQKPYSPSELIELIQRVTAPAQGER